MVTIEEEKIERFIKPTRVIPWREIWDSGIPNEVIFKTAARSFVTQANPNEENARALLDYLYKTPESWNVFESLGRAGIININVKIITIGKERLLKGGV